MGEVERVVELASHDSVCSDIILYNMPRPLRAQIRYSSDVWSKGNKYAGWYWRDPSWYLDAHRPHETALELDGEDRRKRTKEDAFDSSESNQMLTKGGMLIKYPLGCRQRGFALGGIVSMGSG